MNTYITILFFGDVVGRLGRASVAKALPGLRKKYRPDFVIANAENMAHGIGITPLIFEEMREMGVEYFTSGNHIFENPQGLRVLEEHADRIIRPANSRQKTGVGSMIIPCKGKRLLAVNISGTVFMKDAVANPFSAIDTMLKDARNDYDAAIVDFHAEATSEKAAMRHHLDGRVQALWGTHTHVQTADAQITPAGTAYITDVGMCGDADGIIGVKKEQPLHNFLHPKEKPKKFVLGEKGTAIINALVIKIDMTRGKARRCVPISMTLTIS